MLRHRGRETEGLSRVVAAGPPVTTPAGHCHFLGGGVDPTDAAALDRAIATRVERDVDLVKVMASGGYLTPGTDQLGAQFDVVPLRRLVDASHAAGLRIVAHAHSVTGAEVALAAGVDGLEHFTCMALGHVGASDELLAEVARAGALATATSAGADECGVPAGRLAAGRLADLLVVDGDLAADVTAPSRPRAVWLGGVAVEP